ncbi:response regulator, partial [Roseivivax sp. CAU 1761]
MTTHALPGAAAPAAATAARPLNGLTILVVDDSRFACEAVRLLCLHSGARLRRADCLHSARRHLQVYRPTALVVDLGLPDGSGLDLLAEQAAASPRIPALLATSGDPAAGAAARAAGADGFVPKPFPSVAAFQGAILELLPREWRLAAPRLADTRSVTPAPEAFRDDMQHAADTLSRPDAAARLGYAAAFLEGVARCAGDAALERAAQAARRGRGDAARLAALAMA